MASKWCISKFCHGRVQVLLQLCSTTICGQIDRMYIYRKTYIMHAILWCCESCDCNKDEMPCGNVRTTAVRIRHQVSCCAAQRSRMLLKSPPDQSYAAVSASLKVSRRSAQRSRELQNSTILSVKSHSILRMLLQSLRALCLAPGGSGSI